jgi:hypothetical protein
MIETAIATWFVADEPGEETDYPQVGGLSSSTAFQSAYWRCIACFFNSSRRFNPGIPHFLFTNTSLPVVDGINFEELFRRWNVKTIHLPITFRLARGAQKAWGNQLYILDIIKYVAANRCVDNVIVLDADCVWIAGVEKISEAIARYECLTYTLDEEHYAFDAQINGVTRQEMALALHGWMSDCAIDSRINTHDISFIPYQGGEIFAATNRACRDLDVLIDSLWDWQLKAGPGECGVKEEAHFLSILYAARAYPSYTANAFIKRMWTTFQVNNVKRTDFDLSIWHLPAEKKTGFRRAFREMNGSQCEVWAAATPEDYIKMIARLMGIPRRDAKKLCLDLCLKLTERGTGSLRAGSVLVRRSFCARASPR